jgi:hypothetical protein
MHAESAPLTDRVMEVATVLADNITVRVDERPGAIGQPTMPREKPVTRRTGKKAEVL